MTSFVKNSFIFFTSANEVKLTKIWWFIYITRTIMNFIHSTYVYDYVNVPYIHTLLPTLKLVHNTFSISTIFLNVFFFCTNTFFIMQCILCNVCQILQIVHMQLEQVPVQNLHIRDKLEKKVLPSR